MAKSEVANPHQREGEEMTNEEVAKFADWLEKNQPGLEGKEYWELFAYRIADYLQV